jgi:uroporphyrinogen decarboxylase
VEELIPIFLELGIDILNPIQATANNLDRLRALTQGRMALQGGISSGLIVSGPIDAIVAEVRRRMGQLGREGGYFCSSDQGMPWPREHYDALMQAVATYGVYPLT